MARHLGALGLDFELHRAIDWREMTPEQWASIDHGGIRRDGRSYRMGGVAAAIRQREVPKNHVENGPDVICTLETTLSSSLTSPKCWAS